MVAKGGSNGGWALSDAMKFWQCDQIDKAAWERMVRPAYRLSAGPGRIIIVAAAGSWIETAFGIQS